MPRLTAALVAASLSLPVAVTPAISAETTPKAHEYNLSIQDKAAIYRGALPVSDKRFLELLDSVGVAPKFSVGAQRNLLTTDVVHDAAAAVGILSLLGAAFLIPSGNFYLGRSGNLTLTATDGSQFVGTDSSLRAVAQDMITGGYVLAALGLASQAAWFYHPRPFDLDAAQDAIDAYNAKLLTAQRKPTMTFTGARRQRMRPLEAR